MKKFILTCSILCAALTACEVDNYGGPDAQVHGYFYDEKDGKTLIGTDILDGNSIGVYEQGFASETRQTWNITNSGEYTNLRVFAATYRLEFLNTNFYPYKGEATWKVNPGRNERNFLVTPFIRVIDPHITYDAASGKITATCRLEAGGDDVTLKQIRLFVFTDKWVGNRINSGIQGTAVLNPDGETIDPNKVYTLVIDKEADKNFFKYSRNYYFRIGAQAKGPSQYGTIRHNYSPLVVIKI